MVPRGRFELPTRGFSVHCSTPELPRPMVGAGGVEPPTSALSVLRSNQLSYAPDLANASSGNPYKMLALLLLSTGSPLVIFLMAYQPKP